VCLCRLFFTHLGCLMDSGLLPHLGYGGERCKEQGCANTSLRPYFRFFWIYIYRAGRLLDHMVALFLILSRKLHSIFHSSCTTNRMRVLIFPPPCQHLFFSFLFFFIMAIRQVWGDGSLWFWFALPWWVMLNMLSHACGPFVHLCGLTVAPRAF